MIEYSIAVGVGFVAGVFAAWKGAPFLTRAVIAFKAAREAFANAK